MIRGLDMLAAMRRDRYKPEVVFVDTSALAEALPRIIAWPNFDAGAAHIDIPMADAVRHIDWRPVVGLTVHVSGLDDARVRTVAKDCAVAGAARVISSLVACEGDGEFIRFTTLWVEDTAGHFHG